MTNRNFKITIAFLLSMATVSLFLYFKWLLIVKTPNVRQGIKNKDLVIKNGTKEIVFSRTDIELITKTEDCYRQNDTTSTGNISQGASIIRLVDYAFFDFAADNLGVMILADELVAENDRINKSTREPKILQCVKDVFSDSDDYIRLFVRPVLLTGKVQREFSLSKSINESEVQKIEKIKSAVVSNPQRFIPAGEEAGAATSTLIFPFEEEAQMPSELDEYFPENDAPDESSFEDKVLAVTAVGQVYPNIVEDDSSYSLVKVIDVVEKKGRQVYTYEMITVPKKGMHDWLKESNSRVSINIKDGGLRSQLDEYKNIWWYQNMQ